MQRSGERCPVGAEAVKGTVVGIGLGALRAPAVNHRADLHSLVGTRGHIHMEWSEVSLLRPLGSDRPVALNTCIIWASSGRVFPCHEPTSVETLLCCSLALGLVRVTDDGGDDHMSGLNILCTVSLSPFEVGRISLTPLLRRCWAQRGCVTGPRLHSVSTASRTLLVISFLNYKSGGNISESKESLETHRVRSVWAA